MSTGAVYKQHYGGKQERLNIEGAVALPRIKNTNRSLPKGIERFAAYVFFEF